MKLSKSVFSVAMAFLMATSSVGANGQVAQSNRSEVSIAELSDKSLKEVLTAMDALEQSERAKLLNSLELVAEQTKADIADVKHQVIEAQALVDFERDTAKGREQRESRIRLTRTMLIIAAGGVGFTSIVSLHHFASKYGNAKVGARLRALTGPLNVLGLVAVVGGFAGAIVTEVTIDFPNENLKQLLGELTNLESKVDAEVALIQILKVRYGI